MSISLSNDKQNMAVERFLCVSCMYSSLTSRSLTSSLTLAAVSVDCFPVDASLINVDRKFLHFFTFSIVSCKKQNIQIMNKLKSHLWITTLYIAACFSFLYYTVIVFSTCRHPALSDPLSLIQLTLLTVTEATVVPAVWLTVLGVIPGTAAPTEPWEDRHHHHNMLFRLIKCFRTHFSSHQNRVWVLELLQSFSRASDFRFIKETGALLLR